MRRTEGTCYDRTPALPENKQKSFVDDTRLHQQPTAFLVNFVLEFLTFPSLFLCI